MSKPVIGFAGMTHLGIVSAVAAADRGFKVICFDSDSSRLEPLKQLRLPIVEPGLPEVLVKNESRLSFTERATDLRGCQVVYVAVDVSTDDEAKADLQQVHDLIALLGRVIEDGVMVILSQVPPGFTRSLSHPQERCFYQVETLIFGRAVERALYPERIIIGCADTKQTLPPVLQQFLDAFNCPILRMRYESAELTKIAINIFLSASVCTTNTLAELSEKIGADWSEVIPALKLDKRIGQHAYLTPGLGIAGGNLERDLATLVGLAYETGSDASVIESFRRNSRYRRDWALRTLYAQLSPDKPDAALGILGLAYKENTHSIKNSPSLGLIKYLKPWRLRVYDPVVPAAAVDHPNVIGCASAIEAARGVDALVVMTPWAAFRELRPDDLGRCMAGRTVIDPFRLLDGPALVSAGFDYFTLGARAVTAQHTFNA